MNDRELIDIMGIETARVEINSRDFIRELGWKQDKDGLWLSPYKDNYLAGTKTSAIVAAFIEKMEIKNVRDTIKKAADKFA